MRPSEILREKREDVLKIAEKYGLQNLRVFGSVARGEDDEKSDLDLLASFKPGFTLFDHIDVMNELIIVLGCKVDIVSEEGVKKRIRERIVLEAKPI